MEPVIPPAGPGGLGEISAYARFDNVLIPAAKIYIKYGATAFPGTNTSLYDVNQTCGTSGHGMGHAHIEGLHQGAYYLYVVGYDSTSGTTVTGNKGVVLESEEDHEEVNVSLQ